MKQQGRAGQIDTHKQLASHFFPRRADFLRKCFGVADAVWIVARDPVMPAIAQLLGKHQEHQLFRCERLQLTIKPIGIGIIVRTIDLPDQVGNLDQLTAIDASHVGWCS